MMINKYQQASELWLEYRDGIYQYLLKKLKNTELAEELSHQVLMKLYNSCCNGRDIVNIRSWVFQVSHNASLDYLKAQAKLSSEVKDMVEEMQQSPWRELEELVLPLLGLLPAKYSEPLKLADMEGLKHAEVAQKLNLSLTATKTRIQRARTLLRQEIQSCCQMEFNSQGKLEAVSLKESCAPLQEHLKKS